MGDSKVVPAGNVRNVTYKLLRAGARHVLRKSGIDRGDLSLGLP
jgi:hypothetical protein